MIMKPVVTAKKKFSPFSVDSLLSQREEDKTVKAKVRPPQQQQLHNSLNNNKLEHNVIKKEEEEEEEDRIDVCGDDGDEVEDEEEDMLEDEEEEEDAKESRLGHHTPITSGSSSTLAHPTALHPAAAPRFPPGLFPGAPPPPGFIPPPPHGKTILN